MRKLKLDQLTVDSFETGIAPMETGTVRAFATTGNQRICDCTFGVGTCEDSCADTCANTCGYTCGCGGGGTGDTDYETCATGSQRLCEC